ncbi:MAG: GNAT family N-acetyltransferase [Solobacterium sp.]|nr:GNAT family N-acetyltransferase [Solobacterium sp.]
MEGTRELKTERLVLRRYRMEDAVELYEKFGSDPEMYRYSGWNPYASVQMAEMTIQDFIGNYEKTDFYGWAVVYRGELVGTIGAYDYDAGRGQIETGYSIARSFWGRGFAAEALRCVLLYLTEQEGIHTVTAWCASENTGSMKTMLKAGMKLTHTEKNGLEAEGKTYDKLYFAYPAE